LAQARRFSEVDLPGTFGGIDADGAGTIAALRFE
jgi:hypothetical protein